MLQRLIDWLDDHLVSGWRSSWRWWSTQVQFVLATIGGLFGGHAAMIALGLAGVTQNNALRIALMIGVGVVWFLGAVGVRLWKQPEKPSSSKIEEASDDGTA